MCKHICIYFMNTLRTLYTHVMYLDNVHLHSSSITSFWSNSTLLSLPTFMSTLFIIQFLQFVLTIHSRVRDHYWYTGQGFHPKEYLLSQPMNSTVNSSSCACGEFLSHPFLHARVRHWLDLVWITTEGRDSSLPRRCQTFPFSPSSFCPLVCKPAVPFMPDL